MGLVEGIRLNDVFKIFSKLDFAYFKLSVINQSGAIVFSSRSINEGWDGNFKSEQCPLGLYVWVLEYKPVNVKSKIQKAKGLINLIR
jgi:hypothetical protein